MTMAPTLDGLVEVARRLPAEAVVPWFEDRQESSSDAERLFREYLRMHPDAAPGIVAQLESRFQVLKRLASAVGGNDAVTPGPETYLGSGCLRSLLRAGTLRIDPYNPDLVHVDAIDVCLSDVAWHQIPSLTSIRMSQVRDAQFSQLHRRVPFSESAPLVLTPGSFAIVPTLERVALPKDYAAIVHNASGLARLGILVVLAEHIHAGHDGQIMLELANLGALTLSFVPGDRVAQLVLKRVDGAAEVYGRNDIPFNRNGNAMEFQRCMSSSSRR